MFKGLIAFTFLVGLAGFAQATVVIEIDAGMLSYVSATNPTVLTPLPNGMLVQVLASPVTTAAPDGTFGAPSTSSFVTGGDILVASFAMNNNFGTGELQQTISITLGTGAGQIPAGDALLLRWFKGTTYSSTTNYNTAAPTAGSTYGQYRSDTQESNEKGLTWFVPNADGSTFSYPTGLDYQTTTAGGSNSDLSGAAVLALAPAPEPSTFTTFISGFLCLIGLYSWKRRSDSSSVA